LASKDVARRTRLEREEERMLLFVFLLERVEVSF
jgi:hypothetical protein